MRLLLDGEELMEIGYLIDLITLIIYHPAGK